jgi:hypothetical protein
MRLLAAAIAILVLTSPSLAQTDSLSIGKSGPGYIPAKRSTNLYGFLGFGTQSLGDVNGAIEDDERVFQGAGIPVSFDTFGPAVDLGGGLVHQISETIGLGAELGYQTSSVDNRYSDTSGSFSDAFDLEVLDITGVLQFWVPSARGLLFGTKIGVAFGAAREEVHFRNFNTPSNSFDRSGDWDGIGFVAGAFTGYDFALSQDVQLMLHAGYRYRNLGEFSNGSNGQPPSDNAGQPIDFDFSGFYSRVGFGYEFGGSR